MSTAELNILIRVTAAQARKQIMALRSEIAALQAQAAAMGKASVGGAALAGTAAMRTSAASTAAATAGMTSYANQMRKAGGASGAFTKQQNNYANALGKVRVEELRHAETLAKSNAKASQVVASSERLAAARRNLGNASMQLNDAEAKHAANAAKSAAAIDKSTAATTGLGNASGHTLNKMRTLGATTTWAGRQMSMAFTAPLLLAGAAAFKWQMDNEKAAVQVVKVYDGAKKDIDADLTKDGVQFEGSPLDRYFTALSEKMGQTQADVTKIGGIWAQVGAQGESLANATRLTTEAMVLGNMTAEEASTALVAIQAQYRLAIGTLDEYKAGAENLTGVLAQLNMIENQTGASMQDLVIAFSQTAAQARQAGVDAKTLGGHIAALVPSMGSAARAGNALKTIYARVMTPATEKAAGMFAALAERVGLSSDAFMSAEFHSQGMGKGIEQLADAYATLEGSQKIQWAQEIFGIFQYGRGMQLLEDVSSRAGGAMEGQQSSMKMLGEEMMALRTEAEKVQFVINAFGDENVAKDMQNLEKAATGNAQSLSYYQKAMEGASNTVKSFDQYNTELQTVLESNPQKFKQIGVILQNSLTDVIIPLIPHIMWLAKAIAGVFKSFSQLSPEMQKFIIVALLTVAAVGPLASILGSFVLLGTYIGKSFSKLATVVKMLAFQFLGLRTAAYKTEAAMTRTPLILKVWRGIRAAYSAFSAWLMGRFAVTEAVTSATQAAGNATKTANNASTMGTLVATTSAGMAGMTSATAAGTAASSAAFLGGFGGMISGAGIGWGIIDGEFVTGMAVATEAVGIGMAIIDAEVVSGLSIAATATGAGMTAIGGTVGTGMVLASQAVAMGWGVIDAEFVAGVAVAVEAVAIGMAIIDAEVVSTMFHANAAVGTGMIAIGNTLAIGSARIAGQLAITMGVIEGEIVSGMAVAASTTAIGMTIIEGEVIASTPAIAAAQTSVQSAQVAAIRGSQPAIAAATAAGTATQAATIRAGAPAIAAAAASSTAGAGAAGGAAAGAAAKKGLLAGLGGGIATLGRALIGPIIAAGSAIVAAVGAIPLAIGAAIVAGLALIWIFWDEIVSFFKNGAAGLSKIVGDIADSIARTWEFVFGSDSDVPLLARPFVFGIEVAKNALVALPKTVIAVFKTVIKAVQMMAEKVYEAFSYLNPFQRHSPSLVENVTNGMAVVTGQFADATKSIENNIHSAYRAIRTFSEASAGFGLDIETRQKNETLGKLDQVDPTGNTRAAYLELDRQVATLQNDLKSTGVVIKDQEAKVKQYAKAIEDADDAIDAMNDTLNAMRDAAQLVSDQLDAAKDRLSEYSSAPLKGMRAMEDQIFANEMAQKRLQLALLDMDASSVDSTADAFARLQGEIEMLSGRKNELRGAGAGTEITGVYDNMIAGLKTQQGAVNENATAVQKMNDELERLQKEADRMDLEKSLGFDPLRRQIEQLTDTSKEMTFEEITGGIRRSQGEVAAYTAMLDGANLAIEAQELAIKGATEARDIMNDQMDVEQDKLDSAKETYDQVNKAIEDVKSAQDSVVGSAEALISAWEEEARAAEEANKKAKELKDTLGEMGGDALGEGLPMEIPGGTFAMDEGNDIDSLTQGLIDDLNKSFSGVDIFGPVKRAWNSFMDWMGGGFDALVNAITFAFSADGAAKIGAWFLSLPGMLAEAINYLLGFIFGVGGRIVFELVKGIGTLGYLLFKAIGEGFEHLVMNFPNIIMGLLNAFIQLPGQIGRAFESGVVWLINDLFGAGESVIGGFLKGVGSGIKNIGMWIWDNVIWPFVRGIKDGFDIHSPSRVMADIGIDVITGLFNGMLSLLTGIGGWIYDNLIKPVLDSVASLPGDMLEVGINLIDGIWEGIKSRGAKFKDDVKSWITEHIPGWMKSVLDIHSPSGVTEEIGGQTADGLIQGMDQKSGEVAASAQGLADNVNNMQINNPLPATTAIEGIGTAADGVKTKANGMKEALTGYFDALNAGQDAQILQKEAQEKLNTAFGEFNTALANIGPTAFNAAGQIDIQTESGEALYQKLKTVQTAYVETGTAAYAAALQRGEGEAAAKLAADNATQGIIANLTQTMQQWGFNDEKIRTVLTSLGLYATDWKAIADLNTDPAVSKVDELGRHIDSVLTNERTVDLLFKMYAEPGAKMPGESTPPKDLAGLMMPGMPGGYTGGYIKDVQGFAGGGFIKGAGTGTSDSILAAVAEGGFIKVSNTEFIVNAKATKQYRDILEQMNNGTFEGFADGGAIAGSKTSSGEIAATVEVTTNLTQNVVDQFEQATTESATVWSAFTTGTEAQTGAFSSAMTATTSALAVTTGSTWSNLSAASQATHASMYSAIGAQTSAFSGSQQATVNSMSSALIATMDNTKNKMVEASTATTNSVTEQFNALSTNLRSTLDGPISETFSAFGTTLDDLESWFEDTVSNVGTTWDGVKKPVADPARFIINDVYNDGVRGAWNSFNSYLGLQPLPEHIAKFAEGGPIRGAGTGTSDSILARVANGEHVITAREVRGAGGHAAIEAQRAMWKQGLPAFARGGPVDLNAAPWGGGGGESNLKPAAILARRNVHKYWPEISTIGGYRAQDAYPDHPSGLALDIMTGDPIGTEVNEWLHAQKDALALNYTIWKQFYRPAGGGGNLMEDRGSPTQNHMDHVHALFNANGVAGIQDGGVGTQAMDQVVRDAINARMDAVKARAPKFAGEIDKLVPASIEKGRNDLLDFLVPKAAAMSRATSAAGSIGSAESWRAMAIEAMKRNGFAYNNTEQVDAMLRQIMSESSGNPAAIQTVQDVNSGGNEAMGLLQIAKGTWPGVRDPALVDNPFDPWANMNGALRYYKGKYGMDLTTMWGQGHGYDSGGLLPPTPDGYGTYYNHTGKPEVVLTDGDWNAIYAAANNPVTEEMLSTGVVDAIEDIFGINPLGNLTQTQAEASAAALQAEQQPWQQAIYNADASAAASAAQTAAGTDKVVSGVDQFVKVGGQIKTGVDGLSKIMLALSSAMQATDWEKGTTTFSAWAPVLTAIGDLVSSIPDQEPTYVPWAGFDVVMTEEMKQQKALNDAANIAKGSFNILKNVGGALLKHTATIGVAVEQLIQQDAAAWAQGIGLLSMGNPMGALVLIPVILKEIFTILPLVINAIMEIVPALLSGILDFFRRFMPDSVYSYDSYDAANAAVAQNEAAIKNGTYLASMGVKQPGSTIESPTTNTTVINVYGDLSMPNIKSGDDADTLVNNLTALSGK